MNKQGQFNQQQNQPSTGLFSNQPVSQQNQQNLGQQGFQAGNNVQNNTIGSVQQNPVNSNQSLFANSNTANQQPNQNNLFNNLNQTNNQNSQIPQINQNSIPIFGDQKNQQNFNQQQENKIQNFGQNSQNQDQSFFNIGKQQNNQFGVNQLSGNINNSGGLNNIFGGNNNNQLGGGNNQSSGNNNNQLGGGNNQSSGNNQFQGNNQQQGNNQPQGNNQLFGNNQVQGNNKPQGNNQSSNITNSQFGNNINQQGNNNANFQQQGQQNGIETPSFKQQSFSIQQNQDKKEDQQNQPSLFGQGLQNQTSIPGLQQGQNQQQPQTNSNQIGVNLQDKNQQQQSNLFTGQNQPQQQQTNSTSLFGAVSQQKQDISQLQQPNTIPIFGQFSDKSQQQSNNQAINQGVPQPQQTQQQGNLFGTASQSKQEQSQQPNNPPLQATQSDKTFGAAQPQQDQQQFNNLFGGPQQSQQDKTNIGSQFPQAQQPQQQFPQFNLNQSSKDNNSNLFNNNIQQDKQNQENNQPQTNLQQDKKNLQQDNKIPQQNMFINSQPKQDQEQKIPNVQTQKINLDKQFNLQEKSSPSKLIKSNEQQVKNLQINTDNLSNSKQNPTMTFGIEQKFEVEDQKFDFQPNILYQKDQIIKYCLNSNINFYEQIQNCEEMAKFLLTIPELQNIILQLTKSLEYDQKNLKVFDEFQSTQNQDEIKAIMKQLSETQNINPIYVLRITQKHIQNIQNKQKEEIKQILPIYLQNEICIERTLIFKIINFYLKLAEKDEFIKNILIKKRIDQNLVNTLILTKNLNDQIQILKCVHLIVRNLQPSKDLIVKIFDYLNLNTEIKYQEDNIIKLREQQQQKQLIQDLSVFILIECLNLQLVMDFIQKNFDQKQIIDYFEFLGKHIDKKFNDQQSQIKIVQNLWRVIVFLLKNQIDLFKQFDSSQQEISLENLQKILVLMQRKIYSQDKNLYSKTLYDFIQISLQCQKDEKNIEKYSKIIKNLLKDSDEIKNLFWAQNIYQYNFGVGKFFHYLKFNYPQDSKYLCKILKNSTNSAFAGNSVNSLENNFWTDFYKQWVIFLKQLINNQQNKYIDVNLPILQFVEFVCQILIEQPIFLTDIEYNMLNQDKAVLDGVTLCLLLTDSLYYFQKINNPPYKIISLIIQAFTSLFKIQKSREIVCKVMQIQTLIVQNQNTYHPFFEIINQFKNDNNFNDQKFQNIVQKMVGFFDVIMEYSNYILDDFPDEIYFRKNQDSFKNEQDYFKISMFIINNLHSNQSDYDPQSWNDNQTRILGDSILVVNQKMYSTFLNDYLAFISNYVLGRLLQGKYTGFNQYAIGSQFLSITDKILRKYQINLERVPLQVEEQENYLLNLFENYLNKKQLVEFLFQSIELEIIQDQNFKLFSNKIYQNYSNMLEQDENSYNPQLLSKIYELIQNGLSCLYQIVNLIDIFIENQSQKLNLKYLGQLQIISQFGHIFCFKDNMYYYQQFFKSDKIYEVRISLILAITSHIKFLKQDIEFQIDQNISRNILGLSSSKGLYLNNSISVIALKLLSKIQMLWLHLPIQKQPQFIDFFQEILDNKQKITILNSVQLQILSNLEDFLNDPYTAIAQIEFLITCMIQQKQFMNTIFKQQKNLFIKQYNDRILKFLQKACEYCSKYKDELMLTFYSKLIIFITESYKNQFPYALQFVKSDHLIILIQSAFENLKPYFSQGQEYETLDQQQQISLQIQYRFAISQLSVFISEQILQKNSLVIKALDSIFKNQYFAYIQYFCNYGDNNQVLNQKQQFFQQIYQLISQNNDKIQLQLEYRMQRNEQSLQNLIFKCFDMNQYGFGRDYLIDCQELFYLLKSLNIDYQIIQDQILYCQYQNLIQSLVDIDQICFKNIRLFFILLCNVDFEDGVLYSSLQKDYKNTQIVMKKDIYLVNPNNDLNLGTNFLRIFNNPNQVQEFLLNIINTISQKFQTQEIKYQDVCYFNQFQYALEMTCFAFQCLYCFNQKFTDKYIFQEALIKNTLLFIVKGLQSDLQQGNNDGKIINFMQIFFKFCSSLKNINFSKLPEFYELLYQIQESLQNNEKQILGILNSLYMIIKIDPISFFQNKNIKTLQYLNEKMAFGNLNEQFLIIKILDIMVQQDYENTGIDNIKKHNLYQSVINCNNIQGIDKESDQSDKLISIQDSQIINVTQLFFKVLYSRVKKVLQIPSQIENVNLQNLEELNQTLSLLNVIYDQNSFYHSQQDIFESILFDLTNHTILLFQKQNFSLQPLTLQEKQYSEIFAFDQNQFQKEGYNPSLFLFKQDLYQIHILTNLFFCIQKAFKNSQIIQFFNNQSEIIYETDYWEQFQIYISNSIQYCKKIGQKWIQNEKLVKELYKKLDILKINNYDACNFDSLMKMHIMLMKKLFETTCMHLELFQEFKKIYHYVNLIDNNYIQLKDICTTIDETEKIFSKFIQVNKIDKTYKFEKNDESSWTQFQIYKHIILNEIQAK